MGVASGLISVLVLALYPASERAQTLYAQKESLWFLCLLLFYWIGHIWLSARRGRMHDDPVIFAVRDEVSRLLIFLMALTTMMVQR